MVEIRLYNEILEEYWSDVDIKDGKLVMSIAGNVGSFEDGRWIPQGDAVPHFFIDGERIGE